MSKIHLWFGSSTKIHYSLLRSILIHNTLIQWKSPVYWCYCNPQSRRVIVSFWRNSHILKYIFSGYVTTPPYLKNFFHFSLSQQSLTNMITFNVNLTTKIKPSQPIVMIVNSVDILSDLCLTPNPRNSWTLQTKINPLLSILSDKISRL